MPVTYRPADVFIDGPREVVVPPGTSMSFSAVVREHGVTVPDSVIWELRWNAPHIYDSDGNYQADTYPSDGSMGVVGTVSGNVYYAPSTIDDDGRTTTKNRCVLLYALSSNPKHKEPGSNQRSHGNIFITWK
jgi:hypothetical protein